MVFPGRARGLTGDTINGGVARGGGGWTGGSSARVFRVIVRSTERTIKIARTSLFFMI